MPPNPPSSNPMSLSMLWWSSHNPPKIPSTSFANKTILLTGGNVGLGFEALLKYASLGAARLILGVRSLSRGEAAKSLLCTRTGYDAKNVQLYQLDMSSFTSVVSFIENVEKGERKIDAVILNAGISPPGYEKSEDGWEMTLQVNVLSTALLAISFLPLLKRSSELSGLPSHLEIVGSTGYFGVKGTDFQDEGRFLEQANEKGYWSVMRQYLVSKLFVMYILQGLVEICGEDKSVIITVCCPGLCRTNIGREFGTLVKKVNGLFQVFFARTAEEGARTIVSGITLGEEAHGEFWTHDVLFRKSELVTGEQGKVWQKKVWEEVKDVLKVHVPQDAQYLIRA